MIDLLVIAGSYLLGSISSAVIVSRAMGLADPRQGGSGNPGATNVLRLGGKLAGAITLLGDMAKGVVPVLVARLLTDNEATVAAAAFAAFLGHLFPVFFQFRGGKGVATALGTVSALAIPVGLGMGATWLLIAGVSRYSSLASITAAALAPLYAGLLGHSAVMVVSIATMSALLISRHKGNISRLLSGTESRIGSRP